MNWNPLLDTDGKIINQEDETTMVLEEYFNIPEEIKELI